METFPLPADPEKGLPETLRATVPNDEKYAGTLVVFCTINNIDIKARGLNPQQLIGVLAKIFVEILKLSLK